MKKRQNLLKYSYSIFLIIISFAFVYYGDEVWGGIIGLFLLVVCAWVITEMDLVHHLTWFPAAFFLYAASLPILIASNDFQSRGYVRETILLEWVALLTFIIFAGRPKKETPALSKTKALNNIDLIVYPIYIISLALSSFYSFYYFSSGMGKYAISNDTSIVKSLVAFFPIYVLSFLILFGIKLVKDKKIPKMLLIFNIVFSILVLLMIGERDVFFKIVLGTIFFIHLLHKRFTKSKIISFGVAGLILIPIMQKMKSGFVKEEISFEVKQSIANEIFSGEFISASRNLNTLLVNPDKWDFFWGQTFLWDIQIAFFNGSNSILGWFNRTFYPSLVNRGGGNGFTIVGEGYLNFGVFGVILVFIFIALVLRFLYFKAMKSIMWLVVYVAAFPIFIYLNRADLANLYSQVGKQILLPLAVIYLTKIIIEGATKTKRGRKKKLSYQPTETKV